ncbi:MAG TPA: hypothetical protein PLE20_07950, partial [Ornithinibacter sp.]|nr:hypothetical protein [Ornithinibacter sp.]
SIFTHDARMPDVSSSTWNLTAGGRRSCEHSQFPVAPRAAGRDDGPMDRFGGGRRVGATRRWSTGVFALVAVLATPACSAGGDAAPG